MTRDCTLIEVCKLTDSQIVITIAIAKRYNGKTIFYLYSKQSKLKFTVKVLPTHVVRYQSLTKTHNHKLCNYKMKPTIKNTFMENPTYLPSGAVLPCKYSYMHHSCLVQQSIKLSTKFSLLLKQTEDLGSRWPNAGSKQEGSASAPKAPPP